MLPPAVLNLAQTRPHLVHDPAHARALGCGKHAPPPHCARGQVYRPAAPLGFLSSLLHHCTLHSSWAHAQVSVPPHIYGHTGHSHTHIHTPIHGTERHMTAGVPLHLLASMHAPTLGVSQPGPALRWPSSQQRNANSWDALPADVRERPGETTRAGSRAGVPG